MNKMKVGCLALLAALASQTSFAASNADEIKDLKAIIASNSVDRSSYCRYYLAWYIDVCTEAEREAIAERNIAAHRRWIELEPQSAAPHADLGCVLLVVGRWDEAEKELTTALAGKLDPARRKEARWSLADCLWRKGDKDGAKKLIADIVADGGTGRTGENAAYLHRAWTDPDGDIDVFTLPHLADGKPLPTPQEAKYGAKRVSLARVDLKVAGIAEDDAPLRMLKRKMTRFGVKFEKGGTPVAIEVLQDAPVDKPQGYSIDVADGKVSVKARTRQGAIYGIVSLLQCIDHSAPAIRELAIRDWPKCLKRGVIAYWHPDHLEFAVFNKMSAIIMDMNSRRWDVTFSPLVQERYRIFAKRYREFGIMLQDSERTMTVSPVMAFTEPRVRALHLWYLRFAASVGMHGAFELDDERFPLRPQDLERAGTATSLDAKYVTGLYREVKKDYPDFHMTFGPPFYWGPDGGVRYPESREGYLKSIAENLDPEIDVYWTGPRVKSHKFTVKAMKWFGGLVGRKPVVFHNGDGGDHHWYCQFGADVSSYKKEHAPETFDLIDGFYQNTSRFSEPTVGSAMDWCWNPEAHVAETAARRAIEQVEGPGVFEIIANAIPGISYFDKYTYGNPRSELFSEDPDHLDRLVEEAEDAWRNALAIMKNNRFIDFGRNALLWARGLAANRRNPPEWLVKKHKAALANTEFAKAEVGFDEKKGDQFIPSELLIGGVYYTDIKGEVNKERKTCNVKELMPGETNTGKFECEPFPPERPFTLYIVGMLYIDLWDRPFNAVPPDIEIAVNGRVLYKGKAFTRHEYDILKVEVPVDAIARANTVTIRNAGPHVEHQGRPMFHYMVIRK